MKGLPLPFEGNGVVVLQQEGTTAAETAEFVVTCANKVVHFEDLLKKKRKCIEEPKSVLDNVNGSPSPPNSTSTLSSSLGGSGGGGLVVGCGNSWSQPENLENSCSNVGFLEPHYQLPEKSLDIAGGDKCGGEMEDWESVLSESGQEQSILRWIMGDVEDSSIGLNKMLTHGGGMVEDGNGDGELTGGFGVIDQGYLGFDSNNTVGHIGNFHQISHKLTNEKIGFSPNPHTVVAAVAPPISGHEQNPIFSPPFDVKPQLLINQNQFQSQPHQNPTFFVPLEQQHQTLEPKRYNSGSTMYNNFPNPKTPFLDSPKSIKKMAAIDEELGHQGIIIDQLFKAADSIQSGNNPIFAQSILARLNHQLSSPIGKPFKRAAFYLKEALRLLLHSIINNMNPISSPFSLISKISAYKSFSEVSPFVQFTNFTRNQALLEILDGFDQIHIIDFDIGFGDQWASFIQEFALRNPNPNNRNRNSLKITAFASPMNDHIALSLTRDNLVNFAKKMNVGFQFEIVDIHVLASVSWSLPFRVSDNEAIGVNLPIAAFPNYQIPLPLVLRFVKNLSPKIVVSVDLGCERTDLPFPNHLIHTLQSYSNLLESLDAVNMNVDTLQKIERFVIQPSVERIVSGRYSFLEKSQHWRAQFLSSGFSPLNFSGFTETQALCVIKRCLVAGFHIEKRHSSLVLCWERLELVSASAWRS